MTNIYANTNITVNNPAPYVNAGGYYVQPNTGCVPIQPNYLHANPYPVNFNFSMGATLPHDTYIQGHLAFMSPEPQIKLLDGSIDLKKLKFIVDHLDEVLCLLTENAEQNKKYPALKAAYDEYLVAQALCRDNTEEND